MRVQTRQPPRSCRQRKASQLIELRAIITNTAWVERNSDNGYQKIGRNPAADQRGAAVSRHRYLGCRASPAARLRMELPAIAEHIIVMKI
jgi:hypothetical protein